jgi:acyl-CoA thioester hydrolase
MAEDHLAGFGVEGVWQATRPHAVRWSECDMLGHANNGAYLAWCEDMRVAHWSGLGGRFAADAAAPVVGQLEARYLRALGFEDAVLITMRCASLRRTSYVQDYAVSKQGLVFTCRAVLVLVRQDSGARVPIPPAARDAMLAAGAVADTSG